MNDKIKELQDASMRMILDSGDARVDMSDALQLAKGGEVEKGRKRLEMARAHIVSAHRSQTEIIQREADGDPYPYSVLFAHAQDTLMTTDLEARIVGHLIDVIELAS